jgi:hypothetical protein
MGIYIIKITVEEWRKIVLLVYIVYLVYSEFNHYSKPHPNTAIIVMFQEHLHCARL